MDGFGHRQTVYTSADAPCRQRVTVVSAPTKRSTLCDQPIRLYGTKIMGNAQPSEGSSTKQPQFLELHRAERYNVRLYQSYFTASISGAGMSSNDKFSALAGYIGVFSLGGGANSKRMSMAMTSPVLTSYARSVALDRGGAPAFAGASTVFNAPVGDEVMSFLLPFHFQRIEDVPVPTDRRITIQVRMRARSWQSTLLRRAPPHSPASPTCYT